MTFIHINKLWFILISKIISNQTQILMNKFMEELELFIL